MKEYIICFLLRLHVLFEKEKKNKNKRLWHEKKKKKLPIPFFQDQFKVTLLLHKFYKHKVYNSWGIFVINPNIYDNNYNNCHIL